MDGNFGNKVGGRDVTRIVAVSLLAICIGFIIGSLFL